MGFTDFDKNAKALKESSGIFEEAVIILTENNFFDQNDQHQIVDSSKMEQQNFNSPQNQQV